jgi:hypothetical protein
MIDNIAESIRAATERLTQINKAGWERPSAAGLKDRVAKLINLLRCAMWPQISGRSR